MDFSKVTDDQLLQLLQSAMAEAISRGEAMAYAAQVDVLSQKEKAQIRIKEMDRLQKEKNKAEVERIKKAVKAEFERSQSQAEAGKTKGLWQSKMAVIEAIREWGYNGDFEINVWVDGNDRRVYFQDQRRSMWKYCLYVTGNRYNPQGKFTQEGVQCFFNEGDRVERLKAFLQFFATQWETVRLSSSDRAEGIIPDEKILKKYRKALGINAPVEIKLS
jgi:hypothetical protein